MFQHFATRNPHGCCPDTRREFASMLTLVGFPLSRPREISTQSNKTVTRETLIWLFWHVSGDKVTTLKADQDYLKPREKPFSNITALAILASNPLTDRDNEKKSLILQSWISSAFNQPESWNFVKQQSTGILQCQDMCRTWLTSRRGEPCLLVFYSSILSFISVRLSLSSFVSLYLSWLGVCNGHFICKWRCSDRYKLCAANSNLFQAKFCPC